MIFKFNDIYFEIYMNYDDLLKNLLNSELPILRCSVCEEDFSLHCENGENFIEDIFIAKRIELHGSLH